MHRIRADSSVGSSCYLDADSSKIRLKKLNELLDKKKKKDLRSKHTIEVFHRFEPDNETG